MDFVVIDCDGEQLLVGSRVSAGPGWTGTVVSISDPDGDVNEYGLPVAIPPRVRVHWDGDAEPEQWGDATPAYWTARGPQDTDAPYQCDDLKGLTE